MITRIRLLLLCHNTTTTSIQPHGTDLSDDAAHRMETVLEQSGGSMARALRRTPAMHASTAKVLQDVAREPLRPAPENMITTTCYDMWVLPNTTSSMCNPSTKSAIE